MLEARMRGVFTKRCEIDQGGARLTVMEFTRKGGSFPLDGEPYVISKQRRQEYSLSGSGGVYAGAVLSGNRDWSITAGSGRFDVVKPRLFGQMSC